MEGVGSKVAGQYVSQGQSRSADYSSSTFSRLNGETDITAGLRKTGDEADWTTGLQYLL